MTLFVVAHRPTPTNAALLAACGRLGVDAALADPRQARARARPGDTVLGRLDVLPTLDGVEPGVWELEALARAGVRVLNRPPALLLAHDKLATAMRLASAGIAHPRTAQVDADSGLPTLEPPVVVKPRFGSWGRSVELCRTRRALGHYLRALRHEPWFVRQGALVQELVPPQGHDLRVIVAGGRLAGAIERHAAPGEWRTNVALGARRTPADVPPEAARLALAAAEAFEGDLLGVDLLPAGGGHVVLELNGAVDFTADYALGDADMHEAAVTALLATTGEAPLREPALVSTS